MPSRERNFGVDRTGSTNKTKGYRPQTLTCWTRHTDLTVFAAIFFNSPSDEAESEKTIGRSYRAERDKNGNDPGQVWHSPHWVPTQRLVRCFRIWPATAFPGELLKFNLGLGQK